MFSPGVDSAVRIREDQLETLARRKFKPFVVDMMTHLRGFFPDELEGIPDWRLGEQLEDCVVRASGYGLTSRQDLARFLALATAFGWSFDIEMQWPLGVLRDTTIRPTDRLARVHERCLQQLEHKARVAALKRKLGV